MLKLAVLDSVEEVEASASQIVWRRERPPPTTPLLPAEAWETGAIDEHVRKWRAKLGFH